MWLYVICYSMYGNNFLYATELFLDVVCLDVSGSLCLFCISICWWNHSLGDMHLGRWGRGWVLNLDSAVLNQPMLNPACQSTNLLWILRYSTFPHWIVHFPIQPFWYKHQPVGFREGMVQYGLFRYRTFQRRALPVLKQPARSNPIQTLPINTLQR